MSKKLFPAGAGPGGRGPRALFLLLLLVLCGLTVWAWTERAVVAPVLAHTFPRLAEGYKLRRVEAHADVILSAADESGVEAELLAAVMFAESSGRVGVVSKVGALGLFQLAPATAAESARSLGLPEPTEAELLSDRLLNARLGANYFAGLLRRFDGNEEAALVAYNRGPTRVKRWVSEAGGYDAWRQARMDAGGSPLLDYAQKVLSHRLEFQKRGTMRRKVAESGS